jgi:acetyltransferase-like isoleucine patch superfamily enzyme
MIINGISNSFYDPDEIESIGLKSYGNNVFISRKAHFYNPGSISLGDSVRIDDCCLLSADIGRIIIGSYVHISAYCSLFGKNGIVIKDFVGLSPYVLVLSASDDFRGEYLGPSPVVPKEFSHIWGGEVVINKHVLIGAKSIIMPKVVIREGCAIGAMSLVNRDTKEWGIYVGIPARYLRKRSNNLEKFEKALRKRK